MGNMGPLRGQTPSTTEAAPSRVWVLLASPVSAAVLSTLAALLIAGFVVVSVETHEVRKLSSTLFVYAAVLAVGLLLAIRQPLKPIGWLLILTALFAALQNDAKLFSILDYRLRQGTLPFGLVAVLTVNALGVGPIVVLAPTVLLFPDGRLPGARWKWVWRAYVAGCFLLIAGQLIAGFGILGQRIHVLADGTTSNNLNGVAGYFGLSFLVVLVLLPICLSWAVHQVVAYRRSTGERRQQMKVLLAGAAICLVSLGVGIAFSNANGIGGVVFLITRFGLAAFPISVGVAILKYRLYEIDRFISRTLSYAVVTGLVVGVYVGVVTLATKTLGFHTPIAVAASTLAAVALFNPLRVRVQRVVDRRFNRARYDSEATVAVFTARLRDAVDLETVRRELLDVVNRAVEPAHASVWIRRRE